MTAEMKEKHREEVSSKLPTLAPHLTRGVNRNTSPFPATCQHVTGKKQSLKKIVKRSER